MLKKNQDEIELILLIYLCFFLNIIKTKTNKQNRKNQMIGR